MPQSPFEKREAGANDAYFGGGSTAVSADKDYAKGWSAGNKMLQKHRKMKDKVYQSFSARSRAAKGE